MIYQLAAEGIDPTPLTAWLTLVATIFVIIAGVTAAAALLWRVIAVPQIRREFDKAVDQRASQHSALHERLAERVEYVEREARSAIDAEARARHKAITDVHRRIDKLGRPTT